MFKPNKQLGQNFLKSAEIAKKIAEAGEIKKSDTIIEIGPGTGILTEELVKTGASVFAIEKDYELTTKLRNTYKNTKNLKIIHQDALWFSLDLIPENYKVVANIPYNITSPLVRKFLEDKNKPSIVVMMIQKEVAERICAKAGSSDRGLLTLMVEFYADAEILFEVGKQNFYPVPKVDSAVIKLTLRPRSGQADNIDEKIFFKIVKAGFASKRRQIHNSLSATLRIDKETMEKVLKKANIEPTLRGEDLAFEQWVELYKELKNLYN